MDVKLSSPRGDLWMMMMLWRHIRSQAERDAEGSADFKVTLAQKIFKTRWSEFT